MRKMQGIQYLSNTVPNLVYGQIDRNPNISKFKYSQYKAQKILAEYLEKLRKSPSARRLANTLDELDYKTTYNYWSGFSGLIKVKEYDNYTMTYSFSTDPWWDDYTSVWVYLYTPDICADNKLYNHILLTKIKCRNDLNY